MSKTIVEDIIKECIDIDASFSEYDIIRESKERGSTLTDKKVINIIITTKVYPIYYKMSSVLVNDDRVVNVYHPENSNPNEYDFSDVIKYIPKPKKVRPVLSKKEKEKAIEEIRRGKIPARYAIPVPKVRNAGFFAGDTVGVKINKDHLELIRYDENDEDIKSRRTVDMYNGIRIANKLFVDVFNSVPKNLNIVARRGNIKVFAKKIK